VKDYYEGPVASTIVQVTSTTHAKPPLGDVSSSWRNPNVLVKTAKKRKPQMIVARKAAGSKT